MTTPKAVFRDCEVPTQIFVFLRCPAQIVITDRLFFSFSFIDCLHPFIEGVIHLEGNGWKSTGESGYLKHGVISDIVIRAGDQMYQACLVHSPRQVDESVCNYCHMSFRLSVTSYVEVDELNKGERSSLFNRNFCIFLLFAIPFGKLMPVFICYACILYNIYTAYMWMCKALT